MTKIKHRTIANTNCSVSELGLGCASLAGVGTSVSDDQARGTLAAAIDAGISYFDTAPFYGYGRSERLVGDALRHQSDTILLSTKVGRLLRPCGDPLPEDEFFPDALPMRPYYDYSYDGIMRSFEDSLQRLGLSQIDILLMHDIDEVTHGTDAHPAFFKEAMSGGYRALSELRASGLVKAVGLGVNEWDICVQALDHGDWDCFLLAGRYTLLEQSALEVLFPACERLNTSIIIGGPFNSGVLAGGDTYNYAAAPNAVLEKVGAIERICQAHNTQLPAAALQFTLAHPVVSSVIPGPRTPQELAHLVSMYTTAIPRGLWSDLKSEGLLNENAPV